MNRFDCLNQHNSQQRWVALIAGGIGVSLGLLPVQPALAQASQTVRSFVLVSTNEPPSFHTVRATPRYAPRFSDVVGSGGLTVNAANEVTGYYFTVSDLNTRLPYAYHFHAARQNGTPTSCEGDKALVEREAPGAIILDLEPIAPLQPTQSGFAFVGSANQPIALPNPIPLSEIGYLNIHPAPDGTTNPGVICANIRLNSGGFDR